MKKQYLTYREFLNEGLSSSRNTFLNTGKISPEDFDRLTALDTTPTKKYLDSICRFFLEGHSEEEIKTYVDKFHTLGSNLPKKDINLYSFEELKSSLDGYKSSNYLKKSKDTIEVVYENESCKIYMPVNFIESRKLGYDTEWCLSRKEGFKHWVFYTQPLNDERTCFMIHSKQKRSEMDENERFYKICVILDENKNFIEFRDLYDNALNELNFTQYIQENYNISNNDINSIFKHVRGRLNKDFLNFVQNVTFNNFEDVIIETINISEKNDEYFRKYETEVKNTIRVKELNIFGKIENLKNSKNIIVLEKLNVIGDLENYDIGRYVTLNESVKIEKYTGVDILKIYPYSSYSVYDEEFEFYSEGNNYTYDTDEFLGFFGIGLSKKFGTLFFNYIMDAYLTLNSINEKEALLLLKTPIVEYIDKIQRFSSENKAIIKNEIAETYTIKDIMRFSVSDYFYNEVYININLSHYYIEHEIYEGVLDYIKKENIENYKSILSKMDPDVEDWRKEILDWVDEEKGGDYEYDESDAEEFLTWALSNELELKGLDFDLSDYVYEHENNLRDEIIHDMIPGEITITYSVEKVYENANGEEDTDSAQYEIDIDLN